MTPSTGPAMAEPRFARSRGRGNQLLARLPSTVRSSLSAHLEPVRFENGQVLCHAREPLRAVFFPETSVISLTTPLKNGDSLDIGVVGRDGMVGDALLPDANVMPCHVAVQVAGTAWRMTAETLRRELRRAGSSHELLSRFTYSLFAQAVQTAACNAFHSIEERCARWLLMTHDLVDDDEFP